MTRTLGSRLALVFTSIFAFLLAALAVYSHVAGSRREWRQFDHDLNRAAKAIGTQYFEELEEEEKGPPHDWRAELDSSAALLDVSAAVYAGGTPAYASPDFAAVPARTDIPPPGSPSRYDLRTWTLRGRTEEFRVLYRTVTSPGRTPITIECARSIERLERSLATQRIGLAVALPVLVGLGALAGRHFVRRSLRPVEEMVALASEITASDLSRRVPVPDATGELNQLALTLNRMLDRLQASFEQLRSFTSDAAHELKTPVTTMRAALEGSLGRSPGDLREAAADALEELAHLSDIVEKLLLLARADAGRLLSSIRPVALADLARQVADAVGIAAEARGMTIGLEGGPGEVPGDADLLRRAIHNLVENAVKYGRDGGRIVIRVRPDGLDIEDDGPGFPADLLPRLFDRFARGDTSRSKRIPGSGLGLAIVKSIIEAHGGSVDAESRPGRTVFSIRLPASPRP